MKLIALLTIIAVSNAAKLGKGYLPPNYAQSSGGAEFLEAPVPKPIIVGDLPVYQKAGLNSLNADHQQSVNEYVQFRNQANLASQSDSERGVNYQVRYVERPERPQAALERHAAILRQEYENNGDSYAYAYETENGISAEEKGVAVDGVRAQGGFSYTGDDGKQYSIRYTADENGFRPEGDHLPTPPPIPVEILKSLEQNARDEAAGIYDDGSYDQRKYGEVNNQKHYIASSNVVNSNFAKQANYVIANEEQAISDEDSVVTNSASISQGFRNIGGSAQDYSNVLGNSHQDVSIGVNNAYLPPIAHKIETDRSSQNGHFGSRSRKPSFNEKSGYQY